MIKIFCVHQPHTKIYILGNGVRIYHRHIDRVKAYSKNMNQICSYRSSHFYVMKNNFPGNLYTSNRNSKNY